MFRILIFYPSRISDPRVKKAPDPGSGSATPVTRNYCNHSYHLAEAAQLIVPEAHAPRDQARVRRSRRRDQDDRVAGEFGQRQAAHRRLAADRRVPGPLQQGGQSLRTHLCNDNIKAFFLLCGNFSIKITPNGFLHFSHNISGSYCI